MDKKVMETVYSDDEFTSYDMSQSSHSSNFINSIVVPRPIALITSKRFDGVVNAAPFSYFNVVCTQPHIVSIAIQRQNGEFKDTTRNILASKEFVINICSLYLAKPVSITGGDFPPNISEVELAHLSLLPSQKVSAPRIANTLVQMECVLDQIIEVRKNIVDVILAEVKIIHTHKDILNDKGYVDVLKLNPLSRLSGISYAKTSPFCDIPRGL
jgi:flavin reductase (DIM6/NTAB) family NADH-FMN oxidoreductase RutF